MKQNEIVAAIEELDDEQFIGHLAQMGEITEDDEKLMAELADAEPEVEQVVTKGRKPKNYCNNADLLIQLEISNKQNRMTDELVNMLTTLCDRYGTKGNYSGYSFLEDMKAYAMYMLVRTWKAFNVEKSLNPFAFFTQCVKNSFNQYLNKEKVQRDIRDELLVESGMNPSFSYNGTTSDDIGTSASDDY